ncbi:Retrovirus-related Pol polyprotein from transposon [Dictyocoela muelleri]|nr:Retrovirus-related Pol polyprotein from transposon [Dictyocoela muelleri]
MKIYKNFSIKEVLEKIKLNLNETYNTAIKNFPKDVFYNFKNKINSDEILKIKNINKSIKIKNMKLLNNQRKDINYKIGDQILLRNNVRGKLENNFEGPFKITKIFENKNIIEIQKPTGIFRVNIKNIKPCLKTSFFISRDGQNVVYRM